MNAKYLKWIMFDNKFKRKESHAVVLHKLQQICNDPEVEIDVVAGTITHPDIKPKQATAKSRLAFKYGKFWYNVHHVIWYKAYGFMDFDYVIDHINHDVLDNSIKNLRLLTPKQNAHNQPHDINFINDCAGVFEVGHVLLGDPHVKTYKTKADAWAANARLNQSVRRYLTKVAAANLVNAQAKAGLYNQYAAYSPTIAKGEK